MRFRGFKGDEIANNAKMTNDDSASSRKCKANLIPNTD